MKERRITDMLEKIKDFLQGTLDIKGGTFVDLFAVVFLVRLLGPLWHLPAINMSEATFWGSTIASFAYSHGGPKDGQA
jgi:uncharacterized protein (DUF2164 family)